MWKDVSPRTSPCEALKAHLADRFMDRLKKDQKRVYQKRWWLPSRASHGIKYWLRRMRASGQHQDASVLLFERKLHIFLLFLLAPSATAPRGVPAVPWMWRPAVALQFREPRPVTAISLWETRSLEAKPSFLTFCHQMSSFHQALDALFFLDSSFQFRQYSWYCIWWPTESYKRILNKSCGFLLSATSKAWDKSCEGSMASTSQEFCHYRSPLSLSKEDSRISQHDPLVFSPLAGQEFNQHAACLEIDNLLDPELKKLFSGCTVAVLTLFISCKSHAFLVKWVKLFQKKQNI